MAYKGQTIALPLGTVGLVTDRSHTDMAPGSLVEARNVVFDGSRVLKSPGSKKFNNATLDGAVVGLFDWFPDAITQRLIAVTRNGSVYRDTGNGEFNGNTPIKTDLATPSDQTFFAEGGNELPGRDKKLFIFTESNQVQVLQGDQTTVSEISKPAADWDESYPRAGIIHKGRLWVFGNPSAPHRLYASNSEDHEDFQDASILTFEVFPGDGTRINSFIVYNERLFIFKDGQGAYILDDTDPDITNWSINKLKSSFGCASAHGITQALDDVLLKNETGSITSLAASDKFGNVESADVLAALRSEGYMRQNTTRDGNPFTHSIYYPEKKRAMFTYRANGTNENNRLLIFDFNEASARISWEDKDQMTCLALRKDPDIGIEKPIYGDEDGDIFLYDEDLRSVDGAAYDGEIETPWLDFGFADQGLIGKHKIFDALELVFEVEGTWTVDVTVKIDGQRQQVMTYKQYLGAGLSPTPQGPPDPETDDEYFTLDSTALDDLLADGSEIQYRRRRLLGSGRRIKLNIKNSGNGERFTLVRAIFSMRFADEKSRRR